MLRLDRFRWRPQSRSLMLMTGVSFLLALSGRIAADFLVISTMTAMAAMAAMPEHVHGDKRNSDQYPNPVR
jgi:hypothetical protein